jgi:hypothetical protein
MVVSFAKETTMSAVIESIPLPAPSSIDRSEPYARLLQRLSEMSVRKAHDPYRDVGWDEPGNRIEPDDPRLCIDAAHPLAQTAWYQRLPAAQRSAFGRAWLAQIAKYAIGFEAVLSRGLLELAPHVPNGSPEYRYALHEVVEEGRHSMMFQEVINRLGEDPKPVTGLDAWVDDRVAHLGRTFPELLFFAVLGGEIFIDHQNRELLRLPREQVHPLVRRVMQIHVTEEARHVCFAESFLEEHVPQCTRRQREAMAWLVPVIFSESKRIMLEPDKRLVARFGIPRSALRQAFGKGTAYREMVAAVVEPVRQLCEQLGMYRPRHAAWWHALGLVP